MAKSAKKKPAKKSAAKKPAKKAAKKAKKKVLAVPAGYGTVTPHVIVSPAAAALEFYKKAFGAKQGLTMPGPDGIIMHAELKIGDSIVMFSDEMPPMPGMPANRKTPKNAGATTGGLMMYVKDVDAVYKKAVDAGCKPLMPPSDQFWGDRYGQVEDPYGHTWAMATHIEDLTPKQMQAKMAAMGPPPA
ncbi:MAG: VOC family protein [Deltaproteobacteria bacterium]|nr:VOC family protein [Deltaproteobacteria bacterium]